MGKLLEDQPWATFSMDEAPRGSDPVAGICALCGKAVFESQSTLDDCYGVYRGQCPHCEAINLLDDSGKHGIRGYSSTFAHYVLPTKEEIALNNWPESPTRD